MPEDGFITPSLTPYRYNIHLSHNPMQIRGLFKGYTRNINGQIHKKKIK